MAHKVVYSSEVISDTIQNNLQNTYAQIRKVIVIYFFATLLRSLYDKEVYNNVL